MYEQDNRDYRPQRPRDTVYMNENTRTAIIIDGAFYLERYNILFDSDWTEESGRAASTLHKMCRMHSEPGQLHRVFVYDCPPLRKRIRNPITDELVDFAESDSTQYRYSFHDDLKRMRKVALRMGTLVESNEWVLEPETTRRLLKGELSRSDLHADDLRLDVQRLGIEARVGIDIATIALKRFVDRIVLVAGDAGFVPAAKLARREGIDVVLDPMWARVHPQLFEHIDGLNSVLPRPRSDRQYNSDEMEEYDDD